MLTTVLIVTIYVVIVLGESHIDLLKDHYQLRGQLMMDSLEKEIPWTSYEKKDVTIEVID